MAQPCVACAAIPVGSLWRIGARRSSARLSAMVNGHDIRDAGAARRQVVQMVRFPHTYDTQTVYIRKDTPLGDGSWLRSSRRRGRPSINRSNGTLSTHVRYTTVYIQRVHEHTYTQGTAPRVALKADTVMAQGRNIRDARAARRQVV